MTTTIPVLEIAVRYLMEKPRSDFILYYTKCSLSLGIADNICMSLKIVNCK